MRDVLLIRRLVAAVPVLWACAAFAQGHREGEEPVHELAPVQVSGDFSDARSIIPDQLFESPLGGLGSLLDMPRAVALVSAEQLELYGARKYDAMQGLAPSLFSSTIFGISGTPDIRGAIAETYYRGMKRADNRGIFPQPIGAAQRLEIVRGPPAPTHGAGSLGGYVNFVPKTARAESGAYLEDHHGVLTLQTGSYRQRIVDLELGGPLRFGPQPAGFYLYGSYEDSGSYYRDSFDRFGIVQATVAMTLAPTLRIELGGQFQHWRGTEIAGVNRIDQVLIDEGLYQTGQPFATDVLGEPLDRDGNGRLSANEVIRALSLIPAGSDPLQDPLTRWNSLDPATVHGRVALDRRRTIIDPGDLAYADSWLAFVDLIAEHDGFGWKNQSFTDGYDSGKDTTQGFNGIADIRVLENRTSVWWELEPADELHLKQQVVAGVRHQDVDRAWALDFQNFNRRDVMQGPSTADRFHRTPEAAGTYPFNQRWGSRYTAYSIGGTADVTFYRKHTLTVGGRFDHYAIRQKYTARPELWPGTSDFSTLLLFYGPGGLLGYDPEVSTPADYLDTRVQTGSDRAFSYHASWLTRLTPNISWYATVARQADVRRGDAGEYPQPVPAADEGPPLPLRGNFLADSRLLESGIKAFGFDHRIYAGLTIYELERTSSHPRAATTNDYRNRGVELEVRWAPTDRINVFAHANWQRSDYLQDYRPQLEDGFFFISHPSFAGIELTDPGGLLDASYDTGLAFDDSTYADLQPNRRTAIPELVASVGGSWISRHFGTAATLTWYGRTGLARPWFVTLPDYFLVNASVFYRRGDWFLNLRVKNALDADYWQNTDPDYLGGGTVIPMPGRTWEAAVSRQF